MPQVYERTLALPQTTQPTTPTTEDSVLFIGNATVLIRCGGFTILTDPNFIHRHEEVPLGYGLHATRLTDPAMEIEDLPPIDLVVLSHFHGDHFDRVAEERLDRSTPIVTTPEAAGELRTRGFAEVQPLETWESLAVTRGDQRLTVTATPGRHGPPVVDFALPEVMGSVLRFEAGGAVTQQIYITGDTLVFDAIEEIPRRFPGLDLALLHLGGTRVMGITVTMDAEQGVQMLRIVQPQMAMPIHFDDYDAFKSPLSEFRDAVAEAGLERIVRYVERGESLPLRSV